FLVGAQRCKRIEFSLRPDFSTAQELRVRCFQWEALDRQERPWRAPATTSPRSDMRRRRTRLRRDFGVASSDVATSFNAIGTVGSHRPVAGYVTGLFTYSPVSACLLSILR